MNYNCQFCNRKYAREAKLIEHMAKAHPYASLHANRVQLDWHDRRYIVEQLRAYVDLVRRVCVLTEAEADAALADHFSLMPNEFVAASIMLLPQTAAPTPDGVRHIVATHLEFCRFAVSQSLIDKVVNGTVEQLDSMLDEFNRFLNMGFMWNGDNFCPTLVIDLVWHASMMDVDRYAQLCAKFFNGRLLPHCLPHNAGAHGVRYDAFSKQYTHCYGRCPLIAHDLSVLDPVPDDYDVFALLLQHYAQRQAHEAKTAAEAELARAQWQQRMDEEFARRVQQTQQAVVAQQQSRNYVRPSGDDGKC